MDTERNKPAPWGHYDAVDRQEDPAASVHHLDYISGMDAVKRYKQETYSLLDIQPGSVILDIGCGAGEDLLAMAELVGERGLVVGVDSSTTMIKTARARVHDAGESRVDCQLGDIYNLKFSDETFDGCRDLPCQPVIVEVLLTDTAEPTVNHHPAQPSQAPDNHSATVRRRRHALQNNHRTVSHQDG